MAEQQGMQATRSLCDQLQITAEELQTRLAFLSFGEQDGRNLVEIRDVICSRVDEIIGEFYDHLLQFEELRGILSDRKLVERLKGSQRQYLLSLGQLGDYVEYAEARLRIGLTHERVGLKQKWYLGAYHKLFELILQRLAVRYSGDACRLSSLILTLNKILMLDEILVVETYYHATTQRQEDSLCQLKDAHRQLEGLSRRDSLTPVNNRRALMEALALEFHRSRRYRHPFALLFLDVDHFKEINDRHGHSFGDQVLLHVVQLARGMIRPPDIIGRYGGEEFVIGLVECDQAGALQIAERIRLKIAQDQFAWEHHATAVTVSIGVVMLSPEIDQVETLITRADQAMYYAKRRGRNRVELYNEECASEGQPR
ncbi:MAG: diguanylate cyclase [Nitrospirae bacterium]|nr:diguanylate cyclase [Nitrospirota bacterium]MDE3042102.1 diguanylate cyclase [Nitrospirota bacterium]